MVSLRSAFLQSFEDPARTEVIQYGKRLTQASREADVLMFMARKAVCFAECLELLKLVSFHCKIVSDRLLDTNLAWIAGKRVTICDDAVISGTTIYRTVEALCRAGVKRSDLRTQVLCVNTQWHSQDLVSPDLPYMELNDSETASLCARIVDAMSMVPRPYSVDYPLYKNVRVPVTAIKHITLLDAWDSDEVTTPLQASQGVFTITFTPRERVIRRLSESTGWDFSSGSLIKVRLYGRLIERERQVFWCTMFPIVAMEPLPIQALIKLFDSVASHTADKKGFLYWFGEQGRGKPTRCATSYLRVISFIAAARLARLWLDDVSGIVKSSIEPTEDRRAYDYVFPPPVTDEIKSLGDSNEKVLRFAVPPTKPLKISRHIVSKDKAIISPDEIVIEKDLTAPFLLLYRTKELRARELALKYGRQVFDRPEYKEIMNRLGDGFTIPQMRKWIAPLRAVIDCERLISLFLDRAIDRGTVVPITSIRGKNVCRAFRHGEDVEFGEAEERLCIQMLNSMSQASSTIELPNTWIEKSLVLLIRLGLELHIFNAWEQTLGDFHSMGIRYSLHGAVVGTGSNKLYQTAEHFGLTELMEQHGYIVKATGGNRWLISRVPDGGMHHNRKAQCQMIGSLLGTLLKRRSDGAPYLSSDDLILLASCLYPRDVCGALAAEIDAATRDWFLHPLVEHPIDQNLSAEVAEELIKRLHSSRGFFCVHNGLWKIKHFKEQRPWRIIEYISSKLDDPVYAAAWQSFWPQSGRQRPASMPSNLSRLIEDEHAWLASGRILLAMLECSLRIHSYKGAKDHYGQLKAASNEGREKDVRRAKRLLERKSAGLDQSVAGLAEVLRDCPNRQIAKAGQRLLLQLSSGDVNSQRVLQYIESQVQTLKNKARAILAEVDAIAATFGRPDDIQYFQHILHIDVIGRDNENPWKKVYGTYHRIRLEAINRNSASIVAEIPFNQCPIKQGVWITSTGPMARFWLMRIVTELAKNLTSGWVIWSSLFVNMRRSLSLIRAGKSSIFSGPLFWATATEFERQEQQDSASRLEIVVDTELTKPNAIAEEFHSTAKGIWHSITERRSVETALEGTARLSVTTCRRIGEGAMSVSRPNVGIVCIVPDEMRTIVEYLSSEGNVVKSEGVRWTRDFIESKLPARDNGFHSIVVTRAFEQGNRSVMTTYQAIMDEFHPRIIVLLGIGGSINKDVFLGDVVIAKEIIYYDSRAETSTGAEHRAAFYKIEPWLLRYVSGFFDMHGDIAKLASQRYSSSSPFSVYLGAIGTGEAVIKYREAETRKWLQSVNSKTFAVETEAAGLAQQFEEDSTRIGLRADGYLVIRGISDHADQAKDDKWRVLAVRNAMEALKSILSLIPERFEIARAQSAV